MSAAGRRHMSKVARVPCVLTIDIDRIRKLAEAADPGPWEVQADGWTGEAP